MSNAPIAVVPPDEGDGESWYFEVTSNGETWDGRRATRDEAWEAAASLLVRLIQLQESTGRNHEGPI